MKTVEEIKKRIDEIMEQLRFNDINHNLGVFLENKLIHEHNALKWVLEDSEDDTTINK